MSVTRDADGRGSEARAAARAADAASASNAGTGTGTDAAADAHILERLAQRFSVGPKYLAPPAPGVAQWAQAVRLAQRAPDHGALRPWRVVVVEDAQRARLAELFAADARRRGQQDAEVERARERAFNGPGLAALVGRIRPGIADVPEHEQWAAIGAALMNLLNALHLMGFGAKTLSGPSVRDPAIRAAFCEHDDETLAAWVLAGTPTRAMAPKHKDDDASAPLSIWHPRD